MPRFIKNCLKISLVLCVPMIHAQAAEQCPNPKDGYPSISVSMTDMSNGACLATLKRARWLGFTGVSLSPTFYFNDDGTVDPATPTADLESCLMSAKNLGFDIIYKPMIEARPVAQATPTPLPIPFIEALVNPGRETLADSLMALPDQTNAPWRAKFNFRPGNDYISKAITPFVHWMDTNHLAGTNFNASIVVATELHRSLVDYSQDWNNLMWNLEADLSNLGLRDQVEVGLDPTIFGNDAWLEDAVKRPLSAAECTSYQSMLFTADFYSPSMYGDYLAAGFQTNAPQSVQNLFNKVESDWETCVVSRGCSLNKSLTKRMRTGNSVWPGEIGYAGDLAASWSGFETVPPYAQGPAALETYRATTLVKEQQDLIVGAPLWEKAILDNARNNGGDMLSFWSIGRFDAFGFSSLPPLGELDSYRGEYTDADPVRGADAIPAVAKMRDQLQAYTRERCDGWQPLAL